MNIRLLKVASNKSAQANLIVETSSEKKNIQKFLHISFVQSSQNVFSLEWCALFKEGLAKEMKEIFWGSSIFLWFSISP